MILWFLHFYEIFAFSAIFSFSTIFRKWKNQIRIWFFLILWFANLTFEFIRRNNGQPKPKMFTNYVLLFVTEWQGAQTRAALGFDLWHSAFTQLEGRHRFSIATRLRHIAVVWSPSIAPFQRLRRSHWYSDKPILAQTKLRNARLKRLKQEEQKAKEINFFVHFLKT